MLVEKTTVIYQWNFSEIEVYFLPPLAPPKEGNDSPPSEGQGWSFGVND
jgi:hypothetical protein